MKLLHFLAKLLRGHTITTWTRIGRYVVSRKSMLSHVNKS